MLETQMEDCLCVLLYELAQGHYIKPAATVRADWPGSDPETMLRAVLHVSLSRP